MQKQAQNKPNIYFIFFVYKTQINAYRKSMT